MLAIWKLDDSGGTEPRKSATWHIGKGGRGPTIVVSGPIKRAFVENLIRHSVNPNASSHVKGQETRNKVPTSVQCPWGFLKNSSICCLLLGNECAHI